MSKLNIGIRLNIINNTYISIKGAHTHIQRQIGVTTEAREEIIKLLETNPKMKPGCILRNLEKTNVKIPSLADLNNFLASFRKKQYGGNMNLV